MRGVGYLSCYKKMIARPTGDSTINGKPAYKILPSYAGFNPDYPSDIPIPCGKCIGCRLDYARTWADRMMLELDHSKKAIFLTLTYNDENLNWTDFDEFGFAVMTLNKRDHQLFMKRLRQYCHRNLGIDHLKFYCAGEYGTQHGRPHLHYIIFGIGLEDFPDRKVVKRNKFGNLIYDSKVLCDLWENKGFIGVSDVNWKTCAYVARYTQKKVFPGINSWIEETEAVPEFSCMSRRPGIAAEFLDDHPDLAFVSKWYVRGSDDGVIPGRYFNDKLALINPDLYATIKSQRQEFARDAEFKKFLQTDLDYFEQNLNEERQKLKSSHILKRTYDEI